MLAYSCIVHVEYVDQEPVAVEEEEAAEDQEEQQLRELEVVEPAKEQDPSDLTNPDQQPGKHRKHLTQYHLHTFKFQSCLMLFTYAFKSIGVVWIPRCMR